MRTKKTIEEQVAELTEQQKTTVVNIGIWGTVIVAVVSIPGLIVVLSKFVGFVMHPFRIPSGELLKWLIMTIALGVFFLVYFVVIKVVFPYYNDRKAIYLIKNRKKK